MEGNDYDIVVENILFNDLIEFLQEAGGELDLVGQSFLVIKYKTAIRQYDISVPRTDRNTGLGHQGFEIQACESIEDDLSRRDFTINAIAYNIHTNELVDPLEGQFDLENKIISVTYGASFIEDPLRIIRAIRFGAKFQFQLSIVTKSLLQGALSMLSEIPFERFVAEIEKIKDISAIALFTNACVSLRILPYLLDKYGEENAEERYNFFLNNYYGPNYGPELIIAMLYYSHNLQLDHGGLPSSYSKRAMVIQKVVDLEFKYTKALASEMMLLPFDVDLTIELFKCIDSLPEIRNEWEGQLPLSKIKLASELAISGHDVLNLGFVGPAIGEAIMQVRLATSFDLLENEKEKIINALRLLQE